jgi:hypothetical protein
MLGEASTPQAEGRRDESRLKVLMILPKQP